jgi:tetratricopeptide (TPR) repeat protein
MEGFSPDVVLARHEAATPRSHSMTDRKFLIARGMGAAMVAVGLGFGCSSTKEAPQERVNDLVSHGHFAAAVREADEYRRANPDDARADSLHRLASVAYLLEQGRRATFKDEDVAALALFEQAREIEPTSAEVASWVDKTKRKLAETWVGRGLEYHAKDELPAAVEAYEKALEYVPGDHSALNGLATAVFHINFRQGLSERYFKEGLQALSRYWLEQARSRFSYATKYEPEDARTSQRQNQVEKLLAGQRVTIAAQLESGGHYDAARNELRLALALDPENKEARAAKERCDNEAMAAARRREAAIAVMRGKFDDADKLLTEGAALTKAQAEEYVTARADLQTARYEKVYQDGLALERDMQFPEAVAKYGELLKITEYYKDVLTRKETLEGYIRLADELYAKALAATSPEEKRAFLKQIELFWPEYKDVEDQLKSKD